MNGMTMKGRFTILAAVAAMAVAATAAAGVRVDLDASCRGDRTARLAASEFRKFYGELTGRPAAGAAGERRVVLKVDAKLSPDGNDAFAIRSDAGGAEIVGDKPRCVLYGVYALLERRGGCRWFWDGDVVPRIGELDLAGLDVFEHSRFEYRATRYFGHRGLTRFRALQWGPDEWRRELDYLAKIRMNVVMFRLGWGDLFQKAFPDVCEYPDPAKPLPGTGKGYDNQSLHWSLQFRGLLRAQMQELANARGMTVPEDFGTMTHWYTRTPQDFLDKMKPAFMAQGTAWYDDPGSLVWDVSKPEWMEAYWRLTETAIREYGSSEILHTMGLSERLCSTNREENLRIKIGLMRDLLVDAKRRHPESKVILGGWDFHFTWEPEECRRLWPAIADVKDVLLWDYESDEVRGKGPCVSSLKDSILSNWDVIGKFPYTFGVFAYATSSCDIRANYPVIEREWAKVKDDPFCRGYIWWPEVEHNDILFYEYFAKNSWSGGHRVEDLLPGFCESRYGRQAAAFRGVWEKALPIVTGADYGTVFAKPAPYVVSILNRKEPWGTARWNVACNGAADVFRALAEIDWESDPFARRDAIDLARTVGDRLILGAIARLDLALRDWRKGAGAAGEARRLAAAFRELTAAMTDLLALHTDYSLWESYLRLDQVEKVRNSDFPNVLLDNASNPYCRSYQYECCAHWYLPAARVAEKAVEALLAAGDRKAPVVADETDWRAEMFRKGLEAMRPTLPRTRENYRRTILRFAEAVEAIVPYVPPRESEAVNATDEILM